MDTVLNITRDVIINSLTSTRDLVQEANVSLRASSLPYCGIRHICNKMQNLGKDIVIRNEGPQKYYLEVGTYVHEMIQYWLGHSIANIASDMSMKNSIKMLGDWKCRNCGDEVKFDFEQKRCIKCGKSDFDYVELQVKFGEGEHHISGHVDTVLQIEGKVYVIDYKTTSSFAIWNHKTRGPSFPYKSNKSQIEAYCFLLEETYDIEVSGWVLVYMARDNPFKDCIPVGEFYTSATRKKMERLMRNSYKHFNLVKNTDNAKGIIPIIPNKLCPDKEFYTNVVQNRYDPCPLGESGVCFTEGSLKMFLEKVDTACKQFKVDKKVKLTNLDNLTKKPLPKGRAPNTALVCMSDIKLTKLYVRSRRKKEYQSQFSACSKPYAPGQYLYLLPVIDLTKKHKLLKFLLDESLDELCETAKGNKACTYYLSIMHNRYFLEGELIQYLVDNLVKFPSNLIIPKRYRNKMYDLIQSATVDFY